MEVKKSGAEQLEDLKGQLNTNKIFLNMVIHDMRNPTSCIKVGLEQTSKNLSQILKAYSDNTSFEKKIENLIAIINGDLTEQDPNEMNFENEYLETLKECRQQYETTGKEIDQILSKFGQNL